MSSAASGNGGSQPRSFTAPAGRIATPKDEHGTPAHSGVSIPAAHEAMRCPAGTADHPDYMHYYADVTPRPADRVGLPPPKYWSKFAGRIPPKGVLKRLSQDGSARSRLISRLAADVPQQPPLETHVDPDGRPAPISKPREQRRDTNDDGEQDMLDPAALVGGAGAEAHMAAAHARLLAKPPVAYAADEEAARLREDQPRTQPVSAAHSDAAGGISPDRRLGEREEEEEKVIVTEETRAGAARRIQRRCRGYLSARRGHRLLGMLHVVECLGTASLFGPGFPDLLGISVRDQVDEATLHHAMAISLEYECRLHSENFARALLADDADAAAAASSSSSFKRAVLLEHAELRDVVSAGPVDAAADVAGFDTFAAFFGGSDAVADQCFDLIDVRRHTSFGRSGPPAATAAAASAGTTAKVPAALSPGALGRKNTPATQVATGVQTVTMATGTSTTASVATSPRLALRQSISPSSTTATSPRAIEPPLDEDELQLQSELGIPGAGHDDDDDDDGEVAALNTVRCGSSAVGLSTADMSTAIEVPRGWAGASDETHAPAVSGAAGGVWGATTFAAGGGFVDLDDLRRQGGHGAAIMRPKSSPSPSSKARGRAGRQAELPCGECVVCELDSVGTVACPCGNWVHADCGAPGPEPVRCCMTCRDRRWETEER